MRAWTKSGFGKARSSVRGISSVIIALHWLARLFQVPFQSRILWTLFTHDTQNPFFANKSQFLFVFDKEVPNNGPGRGKKWRKVKISSYGTNQAYWQCRLITWSLQATRFWKTTISIINSMTSLVPLDYQLPQSTCPLQTCTHHSSTFTGIQSLCPILPRGSNFYHLWDTILRLLL